MKHNLFYLAPISFIFVATTALALNSDISSIPEKVSNIVYKKPGKSFALLPVLSETSSFPIISGQAALAVDLNSGITLYEKNPDSPLLPASTTKIITALVALDAYPLDAVLTVGNIKIDGQKMRLVAGEKIRAEDLLYGLLVFSANDAAEVLADNYPGGKDTFVMAMNQKAKDLSLENTNFKNPSGLDGNTQVTTARDLIRVSEVAMRNAEFAKIVGTKETTVKSADGKIVHKLVNINKLLGSVDGVSGVKTGWTENARENLVTYVNRDSHRVMIALLGSQDRFGETKELIDWIFKNYEWKEVKYSSYSSP